MSTKEQPRSLDGFVDGLEKRARVARIISIAITIGTITLAGLTLFFTIREIRKRINDEQKALESVRQERIKAENELLEVRKELDAARERFDVYRTAVGQLPEQERAVILEKAVEINQGASVSPSVFIQILDNNQREQANAVAKLMKRSGLKVQGVELVRVPVTLKQTQVKYFRPEFADEAQKIAAILRQSGVQATPVSLNATAGQIEVWFAPDAFPRKPPVTQVPPPIPSPSPSPSPTVAPSPRPAYGRLLVTVIDMESNKPVAGVPINLYLASAAKRFQRLTNSEGKVAIPNMVPGDYEVVIGSGAYKKASMKTHVSAGVTNSITLEVSKKVIRD